MEIVGQIQRLTSAAIEQAYAKTVAPAQVVVNSTRNDMPGDFTVVTFALSKLLGDRPDAIAEKVGAALLSGADAVERYEVVKGFLNLSLSSGFWRKLIIEAAADDTFGLAPKSGLKTVVEFASPNTNKPLHLGHIRNILLGDSAARILEAAGREVVRVQIVNDRGIAICKSMLAWQRSGGGETPASAGLKGDHFVGKYYVAFEQHFREEYAAWQAMKIGQQTLSGVSAKEGEDPAQVFKNTYFNEYSELGQAAREMLLAWEANDPQVRALWERMNGWVYEGFDATYDQLGVRFDRLYHESDTYLLGKDMVADGLARGVFFRKDDGSVWVDLSDQGLDQKIVLRADGTSVYLTQDLGTAHQRYEDLGMDAMIYTVADEQNYHFEVLFKTLKLLGEPYADRLAHLSYGMIELTSGKMKSREGTVVDADELLAEVIAEARANADDRAEQAGASPEERAKSAEQVGLAAIKYYILKVGPKRRMIFDPKESIDLQGATGPYIQYSYVRARGVSVKAAEEGREATAARASDYTTLQPAERELVKHLLTLPQVVSEAAETLDPSLVASYAYNLAKGYHRFWHDHSVLSAESSEARAFRVMLSGAVAKTLRTAMHLLGIDLPERM